MRFAHMGLQNAFICSQPDQNQAWSTHTATFFRRRPRNNFCSLSVHISFCVIESLISRAIMEAAMRFRQSMKIKITLLLAMSCSLMAVAASPDSNADDKKPAASKAAKNHALDRSGKPRKGKASYYARKFQGRKMADGTPMNPQSNVAASKTLPLGTKAEVTNLENGKSTVVE